ncbi:MAG: hypothetical protein RI921_344 [Chloroflexota bacterium]
MGEKSVQRWALVLGASSGIGEASARHAAEAGYNICGVYLGRSRGEKLDAAIAAVQATGVQTLYIRGNAADDEKRAEVIAQLSERFAAARAAGAEPELGIVLHSLAFGSLQPFLPSGDTPTITRKQMDMTSDVMAHSLVYWVQDLYTAGLIGGTTRIYATSSEGASKAVPMYGAVSAAKAAVEAHCRQLAIELAALVSQDWIDVVMKKHPGKRLTTPDDVGRAIVALSAPGMSWVTGNTITIDGGEQIAGG